MKMCFAHAQYSSNDFQGLKDLLGGIYIKRNSKSMSHILLRELDSLHPLISMLFKSFTVAFQFPIQPTCIFDGGE